MFRHNVTENKNNKNEIQDDSNVSDDAEKDDEQDLVDTVNVDEPDGEDVDDSEKTFLNPSQSDEKTEEEELMRCEYCNYDAPNKQKLVKHTFQNHSIKGKWICFGCKEEFDTRQYFNSHNYKYHGCGS